MIFYIYLKAILKIQLVNNAGYIKYEYIRIKRKGGVAMIVDKYIH